MTCDCITERCEVYSTSLRLSDALPNTPKPRILRSKIAELRAWLMEKLP